MKQLGLLVIACTIFFASCVGNKGSISSGHYEAVMDAEKFELNALFSKVKIIPLENSDECLLGRASRIIKSDGEYYIFDDRNSSGVNLFDKSGSFKAKFSALGQGPEEYLAMEDFDVNDKEVLLLCFPNKIIFLDKQTLKVNRVLPIVDDKHFTRVVSWDDNIFIFSHNSASVVKLNKESGETETVLQEEPMRGYVIDPDPAFFKSGGELYFKAFSGSTIYKYNNGKFDSYLTFDFENKKTAQDYYSNNDPGAIPLEKMRDVSWPHVMTIFTKNGDVGFLYSYMMTFKMSYFVNKGDSLRENRVAFQDFIMNSLFESDNQLISWCYPFDLKEFVASATIPVSYYGNNIATTEDEYGNICIIEYELSK